MKSLGWHQWVVRHLVDVVRDGDVWTTTSSKVPTIPVHLRAKQDIDASLVVNFKFVMTASLSIDPRPWSETVSSARSLLRVMYRGEADKVTSEGYQVPAV